MTSAIDETLPIFGTPTTASVRQNFLTAKTEITALQAQTDDAPFLPLSGGTMTGPMYLFNDPTDGRQPATKDYVDTHGGGGGGGGIAEAPADSKLYGRFNGAWVPAVPIAGGTMTGTLLLSADPSSALGAVTKQYADAIGTLANGAVQKAGSTMTGPLFLAADPTSALVAATKQYVDLRAPLASPTFTGTPTAPTPPVGTVSGRLATCGFVAAGFLPLTGGTLSGTFAASTIYSYGDLAAFSFQDRTATGNYFTWYASSAKANLAYTGSGDLLQISNDGAVWFHKGPLTVGRADGPADPLMIWSSNYARAKFRVEGVREYSAGTWVNASWAVTDETVALVRFQIAPDGVTYNTFGSWGVISDSRLKTDQAEYASGLNEICRLRPITFRYNGQFGTDPKARHVGLVGEAVASIMPEMVTIAPIGSDMIATSPGLLVYPLINAVRELNDRLRALENAAG